jgi:hypothetical protein
MSNSIIRGQGAPTANTEGAVGQIYVDTDSGIQYRCIEAEKRTGYKLDKINYVWQERKLAGDWLATDEEVTNALESAKGFEIVMNAQTSGNVPVVGEPVTIANNLNNTVRASSKGNAVFGIVKSLLPDNKCLVRVGGPVTCKYSGTTAPTVTNYGYLCADGDGGVKLATEEFLYYHPIIAVDTENTLVTFMM